MILVQLLVLVLVLVLCGSVIVLFWKPVFSCFLFAFSHDHLCLDKLDEGKGATVNVNVCSEDIQRFDAAGHHGGSALIKIHFYESWRSWNVFINFSVCIFYSCSSSNYLHNLILFSMFSVYSFKSLFKKRKKCRSALAFKEYILKSVACCCIQKNMPQNPKIKSSASNRTECLRFFIWFKAFGLQREGKYIKVSFKS